MSKLTDLTRGEECLIRIENFCGGDPATTVPCHYRLAGLSGVGFKSSDLAVAPGCFQCHNIIDGRDRKGLRIVTEEHGPLYARLAHAEGVMRWLDELHARGFRLVKV